MVNPGSGKHNFLGGVIIAALVVVSIMFDSVGTDVSGRATGNNGSTGCGGGSVGNVPAVCDADEDCGAGLVCVQNACLEEASVSVSPYQRHCLLPEGEAAVSHPAEDTATGLSYRWEEAEGAMTAEERETTETLLNGVYQLFQREYHYEVMEGPMVFRVFSDRRRWAQCMEVLNKSAGSGPFFAEKRNRLFLLRTDEAWDLTLRSLVHEGAHFIFGKEISSGGVHFNEGSAVFMSTIEASLDEEGVFTVFPHQARYEGLLAQMREEGDLMALDAFLSLNHQEWSATNLLGYTQSYSLVYFLMENDRPLVRAMMENLKRAPENRQTHREVIEEHYAPGTAEPFAQFEEDWNTWLQEVHRPLSFRL